MHDLTTTQLEVEGYVLDRPTFEIQAMPMVGIPELMYVGLHMLIKKESGKTRLG